MFLNHNLIFASLEIEIIISLLQMQMFLFSTRYLMNNNDGATLIWCFQNISEHQMKTNVLKNCMVPLPIFPPSGFCFLHIHLASNLKGRWWAHVSFGQWHIPVLTDAAVCWLSELGLVTLEHFRRDSFSERNAKLTDPETVIVFAMYFCLWIVRHLRYKDEQDFKMS